MSFGKFNFTKLCSSSGTDTLHLRLQENNWALTTLYAKCQITRFSKTDAYLAFFPCTLKAAVKYLKQPRCYSPLLEVCILPYVEYSLNTYFGNSTKLRLSHVVYTYLEFSACIEFLQAVHCFLSVNSSSHTLTLLKIDNTHTSLSSSVISLSLSTIHQIPIPVDRCFSCWFHLVYEFAPRNSRYIKYTKENSQFLQSNSNFI